MKAHELLGGARFLPVHWGTFNLAMHDWDEPAEALLQLGSAAPLLMPRLGEPSEPRRTGAPSAWWRQPGKALEGAATPAEPPAAELEPNAPLACRSTSPARSNRYRRRVLNCRIVVL